MKTQYDDAYDDIDEVGIYDYGAGSDNVDIDLCQNEDVDFADYDNFEEFDKFCDTDDTEEDDDMQNCCNDIFSAKSTSQQKIYEGEFDLTKATSLYYNASLESAQMEAIEYAEFFAKKHIFEAQCFIIDVIQKYETNISSAVTDRAMTAFFMFFRNFVRTSVEAYYKKRAPYYHDAGELYADIQDAMSYCWVYIFNDLDKYDYTRARLTVYYKQRLIDAISNFEAKKRFRASKTTMRIDAIVSKAQTSLLEQGITPNVRMIAMKTGLTVEQVKLSSDRILAENTMSRIDADNSTVAKKSQKCFVNPESRTMMQEQTAELIKAFRSLTELEQKVYELYHGFRILIDDNEIIDLDKKYSFNEIARQLDMDAIDIRRIQFSAGQKLKNAYIQKINGSKNIEERGRDKLLRNRSLTFSKSKEDAELSSILDDITSIDNVSQEKLNRELFQHNGEVDV